MVQQQQRKDNKQLVLAVEFTPPQAGKDGLHGTLILPFGLLLSAGVTLRVDDGKASMSMPFRTCLPAGCIVPLDLNEATVAAARAGAKLTLSATVSQSGKQIQLTIPLKGFSQAMDRSRTLAQG